MSKRWILLIACTCFALAVVMQVPQLLHSLDSRSQGIPVHLNSDEDVYLARVQEALNGRPEQAAEAVVGEPELGGSQSALLEAAIGTIFRPTGWRAATVLQVLDSIIPPLLFLTMFVFFRRSGLGRWPSYAGTVLFTLIFLYSLNRPIHQSGSFLLMLWSMLSVDVARRQWLWAIPAGALMGLLVGVYFWSWTYVWGWWGMLMVWEVGAWMMMDRRRFIGLLVSGFWFFVSGLVGAIVALPFIVQMLAVGGHPAGADAVFRSGMHPGRLPESWAYSVLFTVMIVGVGVAAMRAYPRLRTHQLAVVSVATSWIVMHQQVVHGVVFNFVSHYLFAMGMSAIGVVLVAWHVRGRWTTVAAVAAAVYLAALAYDGRHVISQYRVDAHAFERQHFATLLPVLDRLPRSRILTDPDTSMFVAGSSKHDVVHSLYLKNVLMSHEEIAERYCLTRLPVPSEERRIAEQGWLIYPDALSAFRDDPTVRQKEVAMVEAACATMDRNPIVELSRYGVDYVLWDEKHHPEWRLERLDLPLSEEARGEGWSLWKL